MKQHQQVPILDYMFHLHFFEPHSQIYIGLKDCLFQNNVEQYCRHIQYILLRQQRILHMQDHCLNRYRLLILYFQPQVPQGHLKLLP